MFDLLTGSEQGGARGAGEGESRMLSALVTELIRDHFLAQVRG